MPVRMAEWVALRDRRVMEMPIDDRRPEKVVTTTSIEDRRAMGTMIVRRQNAPEAQTRSTDSRDSVA